MIRYEAATPAHVQHVATHLRRADLLEIVDSRVTAVDLVAEISNSVQLSIDGTAIAAVDDKTELAVGLIGIAANPFHDGIGYPWFVGTDDVLLHSKTLMRDGLAAVRDWNTRFPKLLAMVDRRNVAALHWLKHVGFAREAMHFIGPKRIAFIQMVRCAA